MGLRDTAKRGVDTAFRIAGDFTTSVKVVSPGSKTYNAELGVLETTDQETIYQAFVDKTGRNKGQENLPTGSITVGFKSADISSLAGCSNLMIGEDHWEIVSWEDDGFILSVTATRV